MIKTPYQTVVNQAEYSLAVSMALGTSSQLSGFVFSIYPFPRQAIVEKVSVKSDLIAGQQASTGSALLSGQIIPSDTTLYYQVGSPSSNPFWVGDIISIGNEYMFVSGVTSASYQLAVTRGLNGTIAAYHDTSSSIVTANNGLRILLFASSNYNEANKAIELNNILSWQGTTNSATSGGSQYLTFASDMKNLDKENTIFLSDGINSEKAIVEKVNHDVGTAAYDYTIFTKNTLTNTHGTSMVVQKESTYDSPFSYVAADDTLRGRIFIDEKYTSTFTATITLKVDRYA